jgi:hypothetical protein
MEASYKHSYFDGNTVLIPSMQCPFGCIGLCGIDPLANRFVCVRILLTKITAAASTSAAAEKAAPLTQEQKKSAMLRSRLSGKSSLPCGPASSLLHMLTQNVDEYPRQCLSSQQPSCIHGTPRLFHACIQDLFDDPLIFEKKNNMHDPRKTATPSDCARLSLRMLDVANRFAHRSPSGRLGRRRLPFPHRTDRRFTQAS